MTRKTTGLLVIIMLLTVGSTAAVASASSPNGVDEHVTNNSSYWSGQTLAFSESIDGDQTYDLFVDDEFSTQIVANSGQIIVETGNYASGSYELRQGGDVKAEFIVYEQNLDISANPDAEFDDKDDTTEFAFGSNRAEFNLNVTSEQLPDRRVLDIFEPVASQQRDGDVVQTTAGVVLKNVSNNEDVNVTFDGLDGEDKVLDFEVRDTGETASLQLTEGTDKDVGVSFTQNKFVETVGDKIQIVVNFENTDTTQLKFTDGGVYTANLTLNDNNGDGVVTVELNTLGAGSKTGGDYVETLGEVDTVRNDSETALSRPLDVGNYELSLKNGGRLQGTAVASLRQQTEPTATVYTLPQQTELTFEAIKQDATQTNQVSLKDYLILRVTADGIHAPLPVEGDPQGLTEGGEFETQNGLLAGIREVEPEVNQQREEISAGDAVTFYTEPDADRLYLVYRANAETIEIDDNDIKPSDQEIDIEDVYELEFETTANSPYFSDNGYHSGSDSRNITQAFDVAERTIVPQLPKVRIDPDGLVSPEKLFLTNTSSETVLGNTTIAPGTSVLTGLRVGNRDAFRTQQSVVQPDGTVANTFSLANLTRTNDMTLSYNPPNSEYELALRQPNDPPEITSVTVPDELRVGEQAQLSAEATDDGSDAEIQYEWKFDNGETVSGSDISRTFDNSGSYEVSVAATDEQNVITEESATIDVTTIPPTVEVSVSDANPTAGESVTFTSEITDADDGAYAYDWQSDAGADSTDNSLTKSFEEPGRYQVQLVVTDQEDRTAQDAVTVTVSEPQTDDTDTTNPSNTTNSTDTMNSTDTTNPSTEDDSGGIISGILDFLPFF